MSNEEIMKVVKPAICAQLKSPASAQFPVDMISIVGDEMRGYHIAGYVDSQNIIDVCLCSIIGSKTIF